MIFEKGMMKSNSIGQCNVKQKLHIILTDIILNIISS